MNVIRRSKIYIPAVSTSMVIRLHVFAFTVWASIASELTMHVFMVARACEMDGCMSPYTCMKDI